MNAGQTPTRWAVVIGIDHYSSSTPDNNLKGCANDAVMVYDFLRQSLDTQEKNIFLHIARDPASTTSIPDPPSTSPTKNNILASLDRVTAQASPGDFVLIHFSGHGDREPTLYPDKKSKSAQDELLCFINDEDLRDVEFGERLDDMATANQLVVLATLDCCFSGGATRGGKDYLLRYRPRNRSNMAISRVTEEVESESSYPDKIGKSRGMRDAALVQSWLYRDRDYNTIAACQPYETAKECPDVEGRWHGVLTSCLVSSLRSIGRQRIFMTYKDLHGILEVKISRQLSGKKQQPVQLGEQNRILFDARKIHGDDSRVHAHVQELQTDRVVIDKGIALGVGFGDRYRLHDPGKEQTDFKSAVVQGNGGGVVEVIIISVQDFWSEAKIYVAPETRASWDLRQVRVGWFATLIHRADAVHALILPNASKSLDKANNEIRRSWQNYIDPTMPIQLVFMADEQDKSPGEAAKFNVQQDNQSLFTILNSEQKPFENFPKLPVDSPDSPKRLMYLLRHLQTFLRVLEMKTPSNGLRLAFRLRIEETEDKGDSKNSVSSWKIGFENLHSTTLFIAVLNLTPLYGIQQILPYQDGYSVPVEPNKNLEEIFDIEVPEALAKAYNGSSFRMRDIVKVFITSEQIDFRDYELRNLEDTTPHNFRDMKPRKADVRAWCVEDKEIFTCSLDQSN
ncbi:hypothetical protein BDZ45DRAFT_696028 [Acephala macrosclerotiorum]|nr:hypothetical protein BDZ45DRAFT_696028 [Acephala macrosclerotiorum]